MSTTLAALRGKMGSHTYFLMYMKALDLVNLSHIPQPDEWGQLSIEERYQRDLNLSRVKNTIVPYLLRDKDRFLGSVILANKKWDPARFQSITDFGSEKVPYALRNEAEQIGFYTFDGDESLVILDGQHRVRSLDLAIKGDENDGRSYNEEIATDMISVLLIEHHKLKARKIFTKINSNAKRTSTAETLITDDDDIVAVLSRLVANKVITPRLVELKTNQLSELHWRFVTLPTIAIGTETILTHSTPFLSKDRKEPLRDEAKKKIYEKRVLEDWRFLVEKIELWKDALKLKDEAGDQMRKDMRKDYLALRPMPMQAIIEAFEFVTNLEVPMDRDEVAAKINQIPWETHSLLWDRVIISGGKVLIKNFRLVTEIIKYIVRDYRCGTDEEENDLLVLYRSAFPQSEQKNISLNRIKSLVSQS